MSWEYYAVGIEMLGFMAMAIYSGSSDSNYGTSAQDSTAPPFKRFNLHLLLILTLLFRKQSISKDVAGRKHPTMPTIRGIEMDMTKG